MYLPHLIQLPKPYFQPPCVLKCGDFNITKSLLPVTIHKSLYHDLCKSYSRGQNKLNVQERELSQLSSSPQSFPLYSLRKTNEIPAYNTFLAFWTLDPVTCTIKSRTLSRSDVETIPLVSLDFASSNASRPRRVPSCSASLNLKGFRIIFIKKLYTLIEHNSLHLMPNIRYNIFIPDVLWKKSWPRGAESLSMFLFS